MRLAHYVIFMLDLREGTWVPILMLWRPQPTASCKDF